MQDKQRTIHCFRCDTEMKVGRNSDGYMDSMLSDGLFFHAYGNYGSAVFDPVENMSIGIDREFLEIVICDKCIIKNNKEIDHVKVKAPQPSGHVVKTFEPENYS